MNAINTEPFDELISRLQANGYPADAESISSLRISAWTSSSEMIGELGIVVLEIQSHCEPAPADLRQALTRCMKEVRKVWPGIKLLD